MLTLRCTAKLFKRLKTKPQAEPPLSTTRLGDWYANVLFTPSRHLVLGINARTLLPVLVPAARMSTLPERLVPAVGEVLRAIGISEPFISEELDAMQEVVLAKTASRSVLSSMTDFTRLLDGYIPYDGMDDLVGLAEKLAHAPCSPLQMDSPLEATQKAFSGHGFKVVR